MTTNSKRKITVKNNINKVSVIGAGLSGCEASYQLAKRGVEVDLYEMKPLKFSPAHHSSNFAEIVCSNSFKSTSKTNASGLLKGELEAFDSLILSCAYKTRVPSGEALAVDRIEFCKLVTNKIKSFKNIHIINKELTEIPSGIVIIATGPLTSEGLSNEISKLFGMENLYFYDASSPIIEGKSIDFDKAFIKDRFDKGRGDYVNCPMNKEEYLNFYTNLVSAERVELKSFEKREIFEGCMPIEVMAQRGKDSLRFGPLKPIGLDNPKTNEKYYAVVQLRPEDNEKKLYNMVGFQTNLKFKEQKRVFSMIPGLEKANFVKYGVMHRNTFINAPKVIDNNLRVLNNKDVFIAGQLSGVEGYMESTMSGLICGLNAFLLLKNKPLITLSSNTMSGAIINYITSFTKSNFQPMNANYGILNSLEKMEKDGKINRLNQYERSMKEIKNILESIKE